MGWSSWGQVFLSQLILSGSALCWNKPPAHSAIWWSRNFLSLRLDEIPHHMLKFQPFSLPLLSSVTHYDQDLNSWGEAFSKDETTLYEQTNPETASLHVRSLQKMHLTSILQTPYRNSKYPQVTFLQTHLYYCACLLLSEINSPVCWSPTGLFSTSCLFKLPQKSNTLTDTLGVVPYQYPSPFLL